MIHNLLKPCCNECENIDVKAETSRETLRHTGGRLEKVCNTVVCCGHQYVCKKYIECEKEPNKI